MANGTWNDDVGFCLGRPEKRGLMDLLLKTLLPSSLQPAIAIMAYTYEATFIAVKEPKPGPRSKSAGANVPRVQSPEASYVESLEQRAAALTFLEPPQSKGSAGHPELCNKPCLFVAYGACPSGASCNFCHLPHPNQAKLGRADREVLRQLGEAEILALVLPHLRAKSLGARW